MAGVMFIAAQTGLAAVVFSDSFEGVPGDPGPDLASSTGDYDPAWQFVTESLSPRQAVVYSNAVDTSAGSASALITAPEGEQALRLRAGGTAMAQSWLPTNAQATASLYHLEPAGNANTGKMFYFSLREGNVDAVTVGIDKDAGGDDVAGMRRRHATSARCRAIPRTRPTRSRRASASRSSAS